MKTVSRDDIYTTQGRLAEDLKKGREAGAFKKSLVLTRDEKKFAVAREIARSGEEAFRKQGPYSIEEKNCLKFWLEKWPEIQL